MGKKSPVNWVERTETTDASRQRMGQNIGEHWSNSAGHSPKV